jgi:RimJ/RimL family protein N-acetyltransferase
VRLTARVEPDNAASLRVLARCGFTELRGSTDEGELVLARPVP